MTDNAFPEADREAVYRAIAERRDMRHFSGGAVAPELLHRLLQAAQTLGAHPVRGFWMTYVPLSVPGLTSAWPDSGG